MSRGLRLEGTYIVANGFAKDAGPSQQMTGPERFRQPRGSYQRSIGESTGTRHSER
jgi:hypothetical protein